MHWLLLILNLMEQHFTIGSIVGLGRSLVPGADSVDQNVDESAPELAGTRTVELTWLQEWGCGYAGLGILYIT